MTTDPLRLLDHETRRWVEPALQQLGRRFVMDDFEGPNAALSIARDKQVAATSSQLEAATE